MSTKVPDEAVSPSSFTEYLFFKVLSDASIPDEDIVKRFAKLNQHQLEWPTSATTFEELEAFFNNNAIRHLRRVTLQLFESVHTLEEYVRLVEHHTKQVDANLKSNLFALRTAWGDYTKSFNQ